MYEFAKFGCKSSCESSANILLELERALENKNPDEYEFVSIKGHMAPFMYANEYTKSNFSLVYLYALHYSDIISPIVRDSYTSQGIDASYNLGYGLGKVLSKMMMNPQKKYIVLMGDSDLTFGATLEALMYIKTQNYNNITLVIDFNRFGFEARPEGFDTNILKSYFEKTLVVDEKDIQDNIDFKYILFSLKRGAIFVNTIKKNHKIKLFSAKTKKRKKRS
jgi:transketolase N-terminal domain/subunit